MANPTLDKISNSDGVIVLEISEEKNIFNKNALSFLEFSEPLYHEYIKKINYEKSFKKK